MNLLQKFFAGIGLSAIALAPLSAIAQTAASFTNPHKWNDTAAGKTYVFIPNRPVGVPVVGLTTPKAASPRTLTLNNCGWGSFTKSTTAPPTLITGSGITVNWAGKTSGAAVTCTAPVAPATAYTSSNNGAVGTVVDDGSKIWIKGGTTAGAAIINVTTAGAVTTKVNACGFLRITTSPSRPMTNFSIGTTNYTLAALPAVTKPMICRKVGTASFTYIPAN
ncbi:hypothetical protein [Microcoleus sp. OTE_8_concoct_300]|uniref:hypothetical protein n=1 Tax=Microcoleus sp. OTE_8_concoct_300 TaxID=2964710 RepID=UPI00403F7CBE